MGEMKRAIAYEEQQRQFKDRFASTLVIAASIIAAVRLHEDRLAGTRAKHHEPIAPGRDRRIPQSLRVVAGERKVRGMLYGLSYRNLPSRGIVITLPNSSVRI